MTGTRKELTRTDLTPLSRAALGRAPTAVTRIRGGSKKGVYRLVFEDGTTAVAYVWSPDEDLWDAGPGDPRDPFSHASGLALFTAAADRLAAAGVRTPRLLHADPTHTHLPADAALVEDLPGGTLEDLLAAAPQALERMAALLATLHSCTGPSFGKVAVVDNSGSSYGSSCEELVVARALSDLAELPARDPRAAEAHPRLADAIRALAARVRPRDEPPVLIHGELGGDHVRVTADGDLALIDIEGLMYFDVEWEHVFLRLRFGRNYDALRTEHLDDDRLRLYRLAMHLSLVAGPLRLLEVGDFPDPEFMRGIAEHNLGEALTLLKNAS
ncbi:Phosphotransferase enzyme family protein [Streptomyces sp. 3213]|uniref:phosphotransferase family protein n=1 Tax=Streptomyces sp. 3213.3 TaxID=1855348 RepID=UPI0008983179|nr:phosphotransferase [Streptomyces sp. 3213.3]SEE41992.1 Phosphotransferase enzyme family protein [Streptomyces sp. 3213] [Streptomyces sp. 3213.3]